MIINRKNSTQDRRSDRIWRKITVSEMAGRCWSSSPLQEWVSWSCCSGFVVVSSQEDILCLSLKLSRYKRGTVVVNHVYCPNNNKRLIWIRRLYANIRSVVNSRRPNVCKMTLFVACFFFKNGDVQNQSHVIIVLIMDIKNFFILMLWSNFPRVNIRAMIQIQL